MTNSHPLKRWRDSLGLSQEAAGKRLEVDSLTISRWERRATEPQKRHWSKIEEVTGLTRQQFLGFDEVAA